MSQIIKEGSIEKFDRDSKGKKWEDYDTIVCPNGEVIDMQKLIEEQHRAAAALGHLLPALGGLVSKLRFIYTFRVDTQATDGYNIFINPQFTSHLDLTGKTFVLAHEIMHCLLNHLRRANDLGHDHMKANIAADYEVNVTLAQDLELIKANDIKKIGALYNDKYHGWGYEKIYADNPPMPTPPPPPPGGGGTGRPPHGPDGPQGKPGHGDPGGSGGGKPQKLDPDYIKGWNDAVKDYMDGKLNIN